MKRFLNFNFFSIFVFVFVSFFSSCSDGKNTYYEISEEGVVFHYVERKASNFFTATYHERILNEADLQSFSILDNDYAKDKNHIFHEGLILRNRDVESFRVLPHSLTVDNLGAYHSNQMISGSDGPSFRILNAYHYKDKSNVFIYDGVNVVKLNTIDYSSFKVIKEKYAKDKNYVLYNGNILEGINSKQFKLLQWDYSMDPNSVFYKDLKVAANPTYFEVLEYGYAKDDKSIFYEDVNLQADYASFKIRDRKEDPTATHTAEDKYFYYSGITAIKK